MGVSPARPTMSVTTKRLGIMIAPENVYGSRVVDAVAEFKRPHRNDANVQSTAGIEPVDIEVLI